MIGVSAAESRYRANTIGGNVTDLGKGLDTESREWGWHERNNTQRRYPRSSDQPTDRNVGELQSN